jgi:hypothetical protein
MVTINADAAERRFLVQEHREIVNELARLPELAAQVGRFPSADLAWMIGGVIRWLESSLEPHAAWEEVWLYPRLAAVAGSAWPGRLLCFDHEQIHERIEALKVVRDRLAEGPAVAHSRDLPGLLYGLEALVRAHLEREDRFLLPLLDQPAPQADVAATTG